MSLILLVEDDPTISDLMHEFLEGEGCRIERAAHGGEALAWLQKGERPDLILLDSRMPVMSGAGFMAEFKTLPAVIREIPVYLFSAGDVAAEARILGCTGYLKKPIDLNSLRSVVRQFSSPAP